MIKNRLLEIRLSRGYKTVREFAEVLGIHENQLGRYENNIRQPSTEVILRICKKLDLKIEDIVYEVED